jgi:hypothetical protein
MIVRKHLKRTSGETGSKVQPVEDVRSIVTTVERNPIEMPARGKERPASVPMDNLHAAASGT